MVQSRADAESLVKFARYPPVGERSFGPFQAPWADLAEDSDIVKYVTKSAPAVAVIPMIESRAGVADAEGIMTTEGVTGIFVGPVDLRLSMGLTGADGEEPEYVEALEMILRIGKRVGIPVGIFAASPEALKKQIGMGFTYFLVTGDSAALSSGAQVAIDTSRQVCRDLKL
ncbi:Pyruvate/Phosphoenolpyruvate kinase-like domain-containing protein [Coniochaeta sp. 2T2.1]|nr:Pyruvate/Phosphoenolpyruvate kinase-like domain-containing protein [Coniochaeta sp. 2T2.1]